MKTKHIILLLLITIVFYSCKTNTSANHSKIVTQRDYKNLSFGKLPTRVVKDFKNHKKNEHVLVEPGYFVWGASIINWNGKYHAFYSRWKKKYRHDGWLTNCEIAHAVSATPEGPFEFVNVVLEDKKESGWDINNSHNPYAILVDNTIYLYYIANNIKSVVEKKDSEFTYPEDTWFKENRTLLRNNQCIGVAMADNPSGPFVRSEKVVVKPDNVLFKNIAVNPAVVYHNKQYLMIMKGDDPKYDAWFRIQLVGSSDTPEGPFNFVSKPVYAEAQTEDACVWFDQTMNKHYMVCHVMGKNELALFNSENGFDWQPDERKVFMKKQFTLSDGTIWKPKRVERPFVLTDKTGKPIMLYVAVADKKVNGNIAIPISFQSNEARN
jgi:hypothetical protein